MNSKITVFGKVSYDEELPPEDALEFIEWVQGKINSIPKEFRHSANIEFIAGDYFVEIQIYYYRPETVDELNVRLGRERGILERKKQSELKRLAELKRQYERV